MAKKLLSFRVWILIFAVFFSILAINPAPWAEGVEIITVKEGSPLAEAGVSPGEIIKTINKKEISSLIEYKQEIEKIIFETIKVTIETDLDRNQ